MNVLSLFDGISCGQLALDRVGIAYDNYYAAKTIVCVFDHCTTYSSSAEEAYKIADAMLEARK